MSAFPQNGQKAQSNDVFEEGRGEFGSYFLFLYDLGYSVRTTAQLTDKRIGGGLLTKLRAAEKNFQNNHLADVIV